MSGKEWRSQRGSNPGFRRERAILLPSISYLGACRAFSARFGADLRIARYYHETLLKISVDRERDLKFEK
jgi:hypothetical protein